jgi:hypothetical protein
MSGYRLYCLDGAGNIIRAEPLMAATDEEAVHRAQEMNICFKTEVWQRDRLVAAIDAAESDYDTRSDTS